MFLAASDGAKEGIAPPDVSYLERHTPEVLWTTND